MSRHGFISMAVIRRLPRYYRYLNELHHNGVGQISSRELADLMELTASQVRQDFNCFGDFGQQGCGYDVGQLYDAMVRILGFNERYKIVVLGAGRVGCSLIDHFDFERRGFELVGVFDQDPALTGKPAGPLTVRHTREITEGEGVKADIGILTIPRAAALEGAALLRQCRVKAIWNFTNADLGQLEKELLVENVHISDSLTTLCYRLTEYENKLYGD